MFARLECACIQQTTLARFSFRMSFEQTEPEACVEHQLTMPVNEEAPNRLAERVQRGQWLRAAILGANDGLLSTTSLMLGIGAAKKDRQSMVLSGLAGAVAGACSMAVGEFVSVSTQRDIEKTANQWGNNQMTCCNWTICANINVKNPVKPPVAGTRVSSPAPHATTGRPPTPANPGRSPMIRVLMEDTIADKVEVEDREETLPNPFKAAVASGLAFLLGSLVPLLSAAFVRTYRTRILILPLVTSIALATFGGVGASLGGSPVKVSALRVLIGGWIAMAITYGLLKPLHDDDDDDK